MLTVMKRETWGKTGLHKTSQDINRRILAHLCHHTMAYCRFGTIQSLTYLHLLALLLGTP